MKKKCVRFLSALMSLSLLLGCSACKSKGGKTDEIKRRAEGTVEDYLVYLTRDNTNKLSRYCNSSDDPFQQTEQYFKTEPSYMTFTKYLSTLKFNVGDATVDGDIVDVPVKIQYIDADTALAEKTGSMTLPEINEFISDTAVNAKKEIVFRLSFSSDDSCRIQSTKELHDELYGQYQTFLKMLPDIKDAVTQKLDFFMDRLKDMDLTYLTRSDCDFGSLNIYEYPMERLPLFKTIMSFMTYEIEIEETTDATASGVLHVKTKNDQPAGERLFNDPQKMIPFIEQYIMVVLDGLTSGTTFVDILNYATITKNLREELEKEEMREHDVHFDIKLDDSATDGFTIKADITEIMPSKEPFVSWDYRNSDNVIECYNAAAESLFERKEISEEEYTRVQRTFGKIPFYLDQFDESLKAHGYTLENDTASFRKYVKGDHTELVIAIEYTNIFAVDHAIGRMIHYEDLEQGQAYSGDINGGYLYFETYGYTTDKEKPVEVMSWNACAQNYFIYVEIRDGSDEEKQDIRALFEENGLA
ncbi:MAG: hypothetical protein IKZ90_11770 [Clostridiales bacterium]|nr:hypothetical protein [Clostridiales bacterium]